MSQPVENGNGYTYEQYLTWNDGKRWEIINGVAYEKVEGPSMVSDMTPAPNRFHQTIVSNLFREIGIYLKGKKDRIFTAPFDVRLIDHEKESVVQPDLCIFSSTELLDDKGATGAPDWVIEILSPYSSAKDLGIKALLYEKFHVKEYWVVDPDTKSISVLKLASNGKFSSPEIYHYSEIIVPSTYPELQLNLEEIFLK